MHRFSYFAAVLLCLCCAACSTTRSTVSEQGFSAPGRGALRLTVHEPLALAAAGRFRTHIPADVMLPPLGSFAYALYAEPGNGPITRQVHCITSEIKRGVWRWERESWTRPEALYASNMHADGKNWTIQILPIEGEKDWFNALWTLQSREAPAFWLAKRWSATPDDDIRLVVEYREEAPLCLRDSLEAAAQDKKNNKNYKTVRGAALLRNCENAVTEFSHRADAALAFAGPTGPVVVPPSVPHPALSPDMGRLAGRVEYISRNGKDPIP